MGLNHPVDLAAWQAAHQRRWRFWRRPVPAQGQLFTAGSDPDLLVAVDNLSATSRAALLEPLRHLPPGRVAILAGTDVRSALPQADWRAQPWTEGDPLPRVGAVLVTHAVELGGHAHAHADSLGVPVAVVQHGIVTPGNPPPPSGAHLLTWTAADGAYLTGGRTDLSTTVVGPQLLWQAASRAAERTGDEPVYLGQLHSAELPRSGLAWAATEFCLATGARYRPHPAEVDLLSRLQHRAWARRGIRFETSGAGLLDLGRPVVAVYSTGMLEAAAAGLDAWAHYPDPPAWLGELWERYRLGRWGTDRVSVPLTTAADPEPAAAVAAYWSSLSEGDR